MSCHALQDAVAALAAFTPHRLEQEGAAPASESPQEISTRGSYTAPGSAVCRSQASQRKHVSPILLFPSWLCAILAVFAHPPLPVSLYPATAPVFTRQVSLFVNRGALCLRAQFALTTLHNLSGATISYSRCA